MNKKEETKGSTIMLKIALIGVLISAAVFLFGDNIVSRILSNKETNASTLKADTDLPSKAEDSNAGSKNINSENANGKNSDEEKNDLDRQKSPIQLSALDYFESGGEGIFYFTDTSKDIFGNEYTDIIYTLAGFSSTTSYASQTYRISKKYARLIGTVFLDFNDRNTQYSGSVKIYGDGELLWSVTNIAAGFEPVEFDIDVSQVVDLMIYINDPNFYGASGSRCLSNVLLYPI